MLEGMEPAETAEQPREPSDCSVRYCKYTANPSPHVLEDKVGADVVGSAVGAKLGDVVGAVLGDEVGLMLGKAVGMSVGSAVGIGVVGAAVGMLVGSAVGIREGGAVGIVVGGVVGAADGDVEGAPVSPALSVVPLFAPSAEVAVLPKTTAQLTPTITATAQRATNSFRVKMLPPRGFTSSANRGLYPILATSSGPSPTSE
jgi:hypothetical protein